MKKERQDEPELSLQLKAIMNDLMCTNSHPIKRICDNIQCQFPALFCMEKQCEECIQMHENCRSYSFQKFTKLVQRRSTGPIAQFLQKITEIQNALIENIQRQKRKYTQVFSIDELSNNLDKEYFKMIEDIYRYKNSRGINGKEASELFQKLSQTQIESDSRQQELLQTFSQQTDRIVKQYMQVKDWIYDSALGHERFKRKIKEKKEDILPIDSNCLIEKNRQMSLHNLMKSQNKKIAMFSKIIQEEMELQDKIFIREAFSLPNLKFQLVFRASSNDFSASRFHQKCDNIENTFIIIRNEYGRTFAGFTSLTWFGDNVFKVDESNSSFLLSFDERIKMNLSNRNKAIYCSQSLGPTFGGDSNYLKIFHSYDLLIGDKCNVNASSYYEFPKSYQFHLRSTDPVNIFGVQKGKKFKILEYEVYKVYAQIEENK